MVYQYTLQIVLICNLYNGILIQCIVSNKKEQTTDIHNMDESYIYLLSERSQTSKTTYYMTYWKEINDRNRPLFPKGWG